VELEPRVLLRLTVAVLLYKGVPKLSVSGKARA
jgi:hypothetical protein